MPNKKGRNKNLPKIDYDLPTPTAQPPTKKRKRSQKTDDDTPKEFTRLLSRIQKKPKPNGLDDPPTKNRKSQPVPELKIQPSESLRQFNRRVNTSLPVSLKPEGSSKAQRAKEKKQKEKAKSAAAVGGGDDDDWDGDEEGKRKRGRNKGRAASPDPWAVLAQKREAVKFSDLAKAPPTLVKPKSVLHSRGIVDVEGVPKSSGSLAKREGLAGERRGIVEGYRKLVEERRGGKGVGG